MLPFILGCSVVILWIFFVCFVWRYVNFKQDAQDLKDAEELGTTKENYISMRAEVYFNDFLELPNLANSFSANFDEDEKAEQVPDFDFSFNPESTDESAKDDE